MKTDRERGSPQKRKPASGSRNRIRRRLLNTGLHRYSILIDSPILLLYIAASCQEVSGEMFNSGLRETRSRILRVSGATFVALLLVALSIACSSPTPTPTQAPTAPPPTETPDASPATSQPEPTSRAAAPTAVPTAEAEPEPTPLPPNVAPTATSVPVATAEPPAATASPFTSEEHRSASESVYSLVEALEAEFGHREAGTPEEFQAAERIRERLEALGYSAEIQPFALQYFDVQRYFQTRGGNAQIAVESPIQAESPGLILTSTLIGGHVTGPAVAVGEARVEDLPEEGLSGKIALIYQAELPVNDPETLASLLEKVNNVAAAGAPAAVIAGGITGIDRFTPLIGVQVPVPVLILPEPQIGEQLYQMSQSTEITLSVRIETEELESQNVIAELKGDGDAVVVVGGHYDVVPQTESGPNDNTSGIAVILALAEALAGESLPFSVRFMAFGAEEIGLFGSSYYVNSLADGELERITAMLNFDVVGTGPSIAVVGHDDLTGLAMKTASGMGFQAVPGMLPPGASSDHQIFAMAGVPVLMIYSTDVSRIHTPQDILEFVQPERLGEALLVAEAMLRSDEFPR